MDFFRPTHPLNLENSRFFNLIFIDSGEGVKSDNYHIYPVKEISSPIKRLQFFNSYDSNILLIFI